MPPVSPRPRRVKDVFGDRLTSRRDRLSPGPLTVAEFIDKNRHAVLGLSALEIGFETGTSDATVIRAVQALGFSGLRDLKDTLDAWLGLTDSPLEKMSSTAREFGQDSDAAVDFVIESQRQAIDALDEPENRRAMSEAVALLRDATSIGVFGIGASGIIASYTARLFSRSGLPGFALNETGIALAEQLLSVQSAQVLLMMLHGRAHREAMTTITEAKRLNVPIIMVLGKPDSPLRPHAAVSFILPRAKSEKVALHFPSIILAETLHLAYSASKPDQSIETLDRLVQLRESIRPHSR